MSERARLLALDWLRGIAVLVMVECHVFNALLASAYRSTSWFAFLNWLNGFVAPAFLLVSGAVMGINLHNRWGQSLSKLWRRVGQIFIIAYLLHFPGQLLWRFASPDAPRLVALWTKVDILQCIGASLTVILALVALTRTPRIHRGVCAALGILAATMAMPAEKWASGINVPRWLLSYLWPTDVGLFPLVPWAAFPLLGVLLGPAIFVLANEPGKFGQTIRCVLAGASFLVASKFMTSQVAYDAPFVFERMSWILIALAACCWLDEAPRGTKWILEFGQLSLWSYTVHLLMVYWILEPLLGARFSPLVAMMFLVVVLFVTALVVRWRARRKS